MKKTVNWAILAPGIIANSMAFAMKESMKNDERICMYAVGSRNLERSIAFADKWGFKKAYGSYDDLLKDPEVDAVYISNPHAFHFDSVMQCLNAGKHVLCEKPAGCNLKQLSTMIETAKSKKLFFMEAMWTAFNPTVNAIRNVIDKGIIGEIKNIESHFCNRIPFDPKHRLWDPDQAGGALLDLGIYNIYFALFMTHFSPVTSRSSLVRIENTIDAWNSVTYKFESGATTTFQSACDMPSGSDTHDAIIFGTKGYITVQNFFMTQNAQVHVYKSEGGGENDIVENINIPFAANGYEYEMIETTSCILEGKTESAVHPHSHSLELCKMMDDLRGDWGMKYPFEKN